MTQPVIGIAGLDHLGLVSAAAAAAKGYQVVGYDPNPGHVAALERGEPCILEPDLPELLAANRASLALGSDSGVLESCDLIYVAADVPTDAQGRSDLAPIDALVADATAVLGDDAVLVVLSQVPPGFTRRIPVDAGRLYYQVETLVFGHAVERALHPDRFIVGCADPEAALATALATFLSSFECPVLPMRYESAELAKISINACLATTVGAANALAELCERIGADWAEIVPALQLDPRIGPHAYLRPGLGFAGGNIQRDLATIVRLAQETGGDSGIVGACIADSHYRCDWVLRVLHETTLAGIDDPTIAVLGLTYKENTASAKNSPALALIANLDSCRIRAYDPAVGGDHLRPAGLEHAASALEACDGADAVAVMTPWDEFASLVPGEMARRLRGRVVVDPYGMLNPTACRAVGLIHRTLGRPPTSQWDGERC